MLKYLIILVFGFLIFIVNLSFAQMNGIYKAKNDTCFVAYSIIGKSQTICSCPEHKHIFLYGGLLNAIASCNADTISLNTFNYPDLPYKIAPEEYVQLIAHQKYLEHYGTEETSKLSEIIPKFIKALQSRDKQKVQELEYEYILKFNKLNAETKKEIIDQMQED